MFAPCTVTLVDPVPARFALLVKLRPTRSTDQTAVAVPALSPAVTVTRRVPRAPPPVRHLTDVSDSHSVDSHPLCPTRNDPVYVASPMFAPCIVTLVDPVPARFIRLIELTADRSVDHTPVTLPALSPTVNITRRVPRTPPPA
eukprot:3655204-Rhodomonas_salina.1